MSYVAVSLMLFLNIKLNYTHFPVHLGSISWQLLILQNLKKLQPTYKGQEFEVAESLFTTQPEILWHAQRIEKVQILIVTNLRREVEYVLSIYRY